MDKSFHVLHYVRTILSELRELVGAETDRKFLEYLISMAAMEAENIVRTHECARGGGRTQPVTAGERRRAAAARKTL